MSSKRGTIDVKLARQRLESKLQNLIEKKESPASSEPDCVNTQPEPPQRLPSPQQSPRKSSLSKVSRKRKRKEDSAGSDIGQYHHTHVMKLFDRSVDLAQFNENTPLYPICRSWIKNQPHNNLNNQNRSSSPESDAQTDEDTVNKDGNIYHLPSPIKREDQYVDLRIPSPIPQASGRLDIYADPDKAPSQDDLLLNHMTRWKRIRHKWKESSRRNEMQYARSLNMLKDMFDRHLCKES
ncbi:protein lin-37 homolog [Octopus sinensis]|uniref:Protein lin-37 homolog n=1 Tax=Octopus sinensis TaxID=2607531 RepID=A0A6P7SAN3_9MOLL|nr:protein lin-37 homolog [Octopus sinensis]